GNAVPVAGGGRCVEGRGPDPGGGHAGGGHAVADRAVGGHVAVRVLVLPGDARRHQEGAAVEGEQEQQDGRSLQLVERLVGHWRAKAPLRGHAGDGRAAGTAGRHAAWRDGGRRGRGAAPGTAPE